MLPVFCLAICLLELLPVWVFDLMLDYLLGDGSVWDSPWLVALGSVFKSSFSESLSMPLCRFFLGRGLIWVFEAN